VVGASGTEFGFRDKKFTTETRSSRRLHGTGSGDGRSPEFLGVKGQYGRGNDDGLVPSYHACLCRELELRAIPHQSEVALPLEYKGTQIAKGYVIDLLVEESLIVEIKSVDNVHTLLHGLRRILR